MALQKVVRNMLSTGVSDSSDATAITINSSEQVGIGETSPLGKLHAKVSDTGASASAQGNLLVLEDTENGFTFVHNLLSITGELREQPFVKDNVVCIFNWEIYNYKDFGDYGSDGDCLVDLYLEYGDSFL